MLNQNILHYCFSACPEGKETAARILDVSDSVFDAVSDFKSYLEICIKDCPHKQIFDEIEETK